MAKTTIQDVEKAAADLGVAVQKFDTNDQAATASEDAAATADAKATLDRGTANTSKQAMIDTHTAFDAVLDSFLHPTP